MERELVSGGMICLSDKVLELFEEDKVVDRERDRERERERDR